MEGLFVPAEANTASVTPNASRYAPKPACLGLNRLPLLSEYREVEDKLRTVNASHSRDLKRHMECTDTQQEVLKRRPPPHRDQSMNDYFL